ncbi:MAG: hypothetical protein H6563_11220 [Lewinellaceae bacterium]|nr:hypothetical protein [Lewinellaceae bacterium]
MVSIQFPWKSGKAIPFAFSNAGKTGNYTLEQMHFEALWMGNDEENNPQFTCILSGNMDLGDKLKAVPMRIRFPAAPNTVFIQSALPTPYELPSLQEMADIAQVPELAGWLPDSIAEAKGLRLDQAGFMYDHTAHKVSFFSLTVSADGWELIPHAFSIRDLRFSITASFDGTPTVLTAELDADLVIKSFNLPLFIRIEPDKISFGKTSTERFLGPSIEDMMEAIGGDDIKKSLPDGFILDTPISIDTLGVGINPKLKQLENLNFAISFSDIKLDAFTLNFLGMGFQRNLQGGTPGNPQYTDSGYLMCTMSFGTSDPVVLDLSANLTTSQGSSSWEFDAKAQNINVGRLTKALLEDFGTDIALPAQLMDLYIAELGLSFSKSTQQSPAGPSAQSEYNFICEIKYPKDGGKADLTLTINLSTGTLPASNSNVKPLTGQGSATKWGANNTFSFSVEAKLVIDGDKIIELDLNTDKDAQTRISSDVLLAKNPQNIPFNLQTFIGDLSDDQDLVQLVPPVEIIIQEALLAYLKDPNSTSPSKYLFGLTLGFDLELSKLPLVGKLFGPDKGIKNVRILYGTADLDLQEIREINKAKDLQDKLPEASGRGTNGTPPTPLDPGNDKAIILSKGLNVLANANLSGSSPKAMALPLGNRQAVAPGTTTSVNSPYKRSIQQPLPQSGGKPSSFPSAQRITWVEIGASMGPFTLQRIGAAYQKKTLELLMSSSFQLGILNFSLDGLGIKVDPFPPKDIASLGISPELLGMEADLQKGPLRISGGFLRDGNDYYGEVSVQAAMLSFIAIGGYSDTDPASFFIYVSLDATLGGPPFFIVTGLAGGFGINRTINLPNIDTVATYPLLPNNAPPQGTSPSNTMTTVIPKLKTIFKEEPGEYWIAAGIQFTSFEMIDAFVLVTVSFGVDFQLGLLGQGTMVFPKLDPVPLAYVQLDIIAAVTPSTGLLSVEGRLAPNCYVFDPMVHISGGFAFLSWFNGQHKGDFVVSLGGYHPAFKKPAYYPNVPRLEIKYGFGPFNIDGKLYFALVPSMMMAGLEISATWNTGPVNLWFNAGVDFLLGWAPFHYLGNASISIGASLDLGLFSINVSVSADILIWGPKFGGKADVDLGITSVTIHFGADRPAPPPVGWDQFKQKFLPKAKDATTLEVLKGNVGKGLEDQPKQKDSKSDFDWILNPNHFEIQANTVIPASAGNLHDQTISGSWTTDLNIGPMDKSAIQSALNITLVKEENGAFSKKVTTSDIQVQPILGASPKALYGPYRNTTDKDPNAPDGKQLIENTLLGIQISPIPRVPDRLNNILLEELLLQQDHQTQFQHATPPAGNPTPVKTSLSVDQKTLTVNGLSCIDYRLSALSDAGISSKRDSILTALKTAGFEELKEATKVNGQELVKMGTQEALTDWPLVNALGE